MMPQPILLGKKLCELVMLVWVPTLPEADSFKVLSWFLYWIKVGFEFDRLLSIGSSNLFFEDCLAPDNKYVLV